MIAVLSAETNETRKQSRIKTIIVFALCRFALFIGTHLKVSATARPQVDGQGQQQPARVWWLRQVLLTIVETVKHNDWNRIYQPTHKSIKTLQIEFIDQ